MDIKLLLITYNSIVLRHDFLLGIFDIFYKADILMLAPLVNLENVGVNNLSLTVLPLNVIGTSCAPSRAIITENN